MTVKLLRNVRFGVLKGPAQAAVALGIGIVCATAGAGLMMGPCCEIDLNAEVSLGRIWPLPYTGFAGGALKG